MTCKKNCYVIWNVFGKFMTYFEMLKLIKNVKCLFKSLPLKCLGKYCKNNWYIIKLMKRKCLPTTHNGM